MATRERDNLSGTPTDVRFTGGSLDGRTVTYFARPVVGATVETTVPFLGASCGEPLPFAPRPFVQRLAVNWAKAYALNHFRPSHQAAGKARSCEESASAKQINAVHAQVPSTRAPMPFVSGKDASRNQYRAAEAVTPHAPCMQGLDATRRDHHQADLTRDCNCRRGCRALFPCGGYDRRKGGTALFDPSSFRKWRTRPSAAPTRLGTARGKSRTAFESASGEPSRGLFRDVPAANGAPGRVSAHDCECGTPNGSLADARAQSR